jgi:D-alanyl-D-alanine carboxypeptidase
MRGRAACWLVVAITGCGSQAPPPAPPGPRLTPHTARALAAAFDQKVADTGIPGASAAVAFPDGREWSAAAGVAVVHPRQPMTPNTTLPLDSVTKMATAALALRLQEQGRLRLDDPIRRWYPAWRGDPGATLRELLGHTAGTRDPPEAFENRLLQLQRRISPRQFIAASPKPGPPTTDAEYSNTGFTIAGLVLARAAGEPVAAAMRRELFGHPGGGGLALQPAETPHAPRAHTYWYPNGLNDQTDTSDGGPLLPNAVWASMDLTAGGLAGDVPSLARWGRELLGGHILKPASLNEMTRFHDGAFWQGYGLGLARDSYQGRDMWGHTGDGHGSHTELWYFPHERLTVAVSWNDDLIDRDGGILNALMGAALES